MLALTRLAEDIVKLSPGHLQTIPMDESLRDAIVAKLDYGMVMQVVSPQLASQAHSVQFFFQYPYVAGRENCNHDPEINKCNR